jgi:hypothetical protein
VSAFTAPSFVGKRAKCVAASIFYKCRMGAKVQISVVLPAGVGPDRVGVADIG